MSDIEASGLVPSDRVEVFAFLSDLENHWQLADRFIEVLSLERSSPAAPAHGGRVRMRGPLGLSRTATTVVAAVAPPHEMRGTGTIGSRTSGSVRWRLEEEGAQTRVHLSAGVENASPFDQGLLALGGRAWLERRFLDVLHRLAERFSEGEGEAARPVSPSCAVTTARGGGWASRGGRPVGARPNR